jgi:hypothetical protein
MKIIKVLFVFFGIFALFPETCLAYDCTPRNDPQDAYNKADSVALVRMIGKSDDHSFYGGEFEVIRSWKQELPKTINLVRPKFLWYDFSREGEYILYLDRDEEGNLTARDCSGNIHESESAFHPRLLALEKAVECGCKGFDAQGFDAQYLYDRADVIMEAEVKYILEDKDKRYANINIHLFGKPYDLLLVSGETHVMLEDKRPDCADPSELERGYCKQSDISSKKDCVYPLEEGKRYLLYLQLDDRIEGYKTNICSGNLELRDDLLLRRAATYSGWERVAKKRREEKINAHEGPDK